MNDYKYCLRSVAIGDFCGSSFEGHQGLIDASYINDDNMLYCKGYNINRLTDDSVCTMAIASSIMNGRFDWENQLRRFGKQYPSVGYGPMFFNWLRGKQPNGYGSWGNGSAMRSSAIGWYANSLDECDKLVSESCQCTHNTIDAIQGAQIMCRAIFLAKNGYTKQDIIKPLYEFYPKWEQTDFDNYIQFFESQGEEINFDWYLKCDNIVGMCLKAFEVSTDFEHCLKLVISQGYDTDTAGAIVAPLAYAYYKEIPQKYLNVINKVFDAEMELIDDVFSSKFVNLSTNINNES